MARNLAASLLVIVWSAPLAATNDASAPVPSDSAHTTAAERLALLQPACGSSAQENGCSSCPPGTDFPNDQLSLKGVIYGHFLDAHSDDAAAGFFGCESHASGFGGVLLLSRQNSAWKLVSVRPASIVDDCKKLQGRDGHDVLICFGQDQHQGIGSSFLYLLDFERPWNQEEGLDIFLMVTNSAEACVPISSPQEGLVSETVERVLFSEPGRIVVEARLGSISSARFKAVASHCRAGDATPYPLGLRLATVARTYAFSFDGRRVAPLLGNPPLVRNETIAPETHALLPGLYTAPDGSFTIPVPYTFTIIRNPRSSPSSVCNASALVCLVDADAKIPAAIEISRIEAGSETACLRPEHLPGRSSHFVPGDYGYSGQLTGGPGRYEFWTGASDDYQVDQSVNRVWHGRTCYQVAANIAHKENAVANDDQIGQDLVRVAVEFRFR